MILEALKIGIILVAGSWGSQVPAENEENFIEKYPSIVRHQYQNYIQLYPKTQKLSDFVSIYKTLTTEGDRFSAPLQVVWKKYWFASDEQKPGQAMPTQPKFEWAVAAFPGMVLSNEAEGNVMILRPSWKALAILAKQTTDSTQDDRFTALMLQLHGEQWSGYPQWMEQTWDYGGCSRLGSGKHTFFLKEIQSQIKNGSVFKKTLQEQEEYLINDLLMANELCHSKANALKELSQMEKQFSWSSQQKQAIATQRQRIQTDQVQAVEDQ